MTTNTSFGLFPAPVKVAKLTRHDTTPAKVPLLPGKTSPLQNETPAQPQQEVDLNLSAKLYASLRLLRTQLVKEAGEGVMAYHIFGNATLQQISRRIPRTKEELLEISGIGKAKITKYGDRVLETIESIIEDYKKTDVNNNTGSGNDIADIIKRRKSTCILDMDPEEHDDFIESAGLAKRRAVMKSTTKEGAGSHDSVVYYDNLDSDDF
ncbi:hypothetical protein ACLOJK_039880 [Asimina triloba]